MARTQFRSMARPRRHGYDKLALILLGAFIIVAIIAALVAFNLVKNLVQGWVSTPLQGAPNITQPTQVDAQGTPIPMDVPLQASSGPAAQPWDGTSRVTILIIGLDYRDWEAGGPPRSDTMMLLTLDPISKTAGMFSIPRDMWVNIPQVNSYHKINEAYRYGELYNLPGGGPALAAETVHAFLGVPINYYAQIDFYSFEKFIDEIGGIDVTVDSELKIDPLGKGNTIYLKPGTTHLTGAAALGFARMRYTNGGDFDRADRQQQVILAIRDQILKVNMLPNLVANAGNIYKDLANGIRTNLTIDQALKLALFAKDINKDNIKKAVIGPNEVEFATSPDGLDILVPHPDAIRILRDQIFTTGGPAGPAAISQDEATLLKAENARVSFRNGTTSMGMATTTADYFKKNGVNVVETANADKAYPNTMIYINGSTPYTAAYLAKIMNVATGQVVSQYQADAKQDIVVIIGQDWARKNPIGAK
jgi:polyisoprenyl-teichoic acid--peptidoglycan teichoic acid transferase